MRNEAEEKESGIGHSLLGMFPSVSLFKEYQNAAMAVIILITLFQYSDFSLWELRCRRCFSVQN